MKKLMTMITLGMLMSPLAVAAEHTRNSETPSVAIRCGEYPVKVLPSEQGANQVDQNSKARSAK